MPTPQNRDDAWLVKRIQSRVRSGLNGPDGEVTDVRQDVFNAYMGDLMGNERDGHSQIVTREVLQAVEWALPALMRVFLGGLRAVDFRASGPDDVEQAKHETDVVNYWFFDGNPDQSGFIILYTFLKDLLMSPNAYLSVEPTEEEERETRTLSGVSDMQIDALEEAGGSVKIVETEDADGVRLHEVVVTTSKVVKRVEVSTLPPDCVIVDRGHHQLNLDKCRAVIIRDIDKTLSDVREMGFDVELDEIGPAEDGSLWNDEETNRLFYSEEQPDSREDVYDVDADKPVIVHTCYMRVDWDDDGISELRRIIMVGCKIVENEEFELQTVVAGSALPMPHKHIGMGYGELVMDLQQLMTTLTRQLLDNIYAQNIQRTFIDERALLTDGTTMDALLDSTSQFIPMRGSPAASVMPEVITPIVAEITQAMEAVKDNPQLRTGVAPQLSLDPSVLEKSTMGAFMIGLDQASQRLELLARLVAETVLKPVFLKIHHILRTHFDEPQTLQIGGEWVQTDPRKWRKRSTMTCNVGLGFNSRQIMVQLLQTLLAIQKEALPSGLADTKRIYATLEKLVEHANLGHAGTFFNDPRKPEFKAPPQQEDPAMLLAKAQAAALYAETKRKDLEAQAKAAADRENAEAQAAKLLNEFVGLKDRGVLTMAQIAEIMARITHMNRDKSAQEGPVEDSSDDEFARAAGLVSGDNERPMLSRAPK
jgi:hypothetical protein